MKSNAASIKLGYGKGCLDLLVSEEAEVVLPQELAGQARMRLKDLWIGQLEKAWTNFKAAGRPQFWSAISPGLLPAISCFRHSLRG